MKKRILAFAAFVSGLSGLEAQHYPLFSQSFNNPILINPAYAGRNELLEATLGHRRQWMGFNGSPVTTMVNIHSPLKNNSTNVGFSLVSDKIGVSANQFITGVYAYRFRVRSTVCSFGLQAGVAVSRTDWEGLKRNDVNDVTVIGQQKTQTGFITGLGYHMYNEIFSLGISIPYAVNSHSFRSIGASPVYFTGTWNVNTGHDSTQIRPSLVIRYAGGSPLQFDLGALYSYRQKFGGGAYYRYKESVVILLEYTAAKDFKVAYSYDFGTGTLRRYHNGSHELMLRFFIRKLKKADDSREGESEGKVN